MMRVTVLATVLLVLAVQARAAPIVLYDPAAGTGKAAGGPAACGDLSRPCDTLSTTTTATTSTEVAPPPASSPLPAGMEVGTSGFVSAGVSNHGNAESAGVMAWLRDGDSTFAVGLSGNLLNFNGGRYVTAPVPAAPRP